MQVKINTRGRFHAITIKESQFAANMTAELDQTVLPFLQNDVKNVILNLKDIQNMDIAAAQHLVKLQGHFSQANASFVICALQKAQAKKLDQLGLLDTLNTAPTEKEAADIVHMEELERELTDKED